MSIEFIACAICGETFPDCGEYYYCESCDRYFCNDCGHDEHKSGLLIDENNYIVLSCKFCRNEDFDDETLLEFALKKLNISKNDLKLELVNLKKTEVKPNEQQY